MMRWVVVGCAREGKFRNFTAEKGRDSIHYYDSEANAIDFIAVQAVH